MSAALGVDHRRGAARIGRPLAIGLAVAMTLTGCAESVDDASSAYDATAEAAGDLKESVSSAAESACDDFQGAIDAVPGDASLSEAAGQYAAAARQYQAPLATTAASAGCEATPS